jgi:hypothetical protein
MEEKRKVLIYRRGNGKWKKRENYDYALRLFLFNFSER